LAINQLTRLPWVQVMIVAMHQHANGSQAFSFCSPLFAA
jgi:hypothetical protein